MANTAEFLQYHKKQIIEIWTKSLVDRQTADNRCVIIVDFEYAGAQRMCMLLTGCSEEFFAERKSANQILVCVIENKKFVDAISSCPLKPLMDGDMWVVVFYRDRTFATTISELLHDSSGEN